MILRRLRAETRCCDRQAWLVAKKNWVGCVVKLDIFLYNAETNLGRLGVPAHLAYWFQPRYHVSPQKELAWNDVWFESQRKQFLKKISVAVYRLLWASKLTLCCESFAILDCISHYCFAFACRRCQCVQSQRVLISGFAVFTVCCAHGSFWRLGMSPRLFDNNMAHGIHPHNNALDGYSDKDLFHGDH